MRNVQGHSGADGTAATDMVSTHLWIRGSEPCSLLGNACSSKFTHPFAMNCVLGTCSAIL